MNKIPPLFKFLICSLFYFIVSQPLAAYCQEQSPIKTPIQEEECSMITPVFIPPGDFLLQMNSEEVPVDEILSEETQAIIDRMFDIAKGERIDTGEHPVMVGLAAPQIGIRKRIILVDI